MELEVPTIRPHTVLMKYTLVLEITIQSPKVGTDSRLLKKSPIFATTTEERRNYVLLGFPDMKVALLTIPITFL
jgi:hypothetical protein